MVVVGLVRLVVSVEFVIWCLMMLVMWVYVCLDWVEFRLLGRLIGRI